RMLADGTLALTDSTALVYLPGINLVFCALVGASVIGASTSLVVDSRRGSLARLALSGATPRQVVATVMTQLVAVSLACAVLGDVIAYAVLQPTLDVLASERSAELVPPTAVYALWPALLANLLAVGLALVGGFRQAYRASRIPPVE
ncbi:FtsX-like permease family protein, partial [Xanthomonas citri pv. citri]